VLIPTASFAEGEDDDQRHRGGGLLFSALRGEVARREVFGVHVRRFLVQHGGRAPIVLSFSVILSATFAQRVARKRERVLSRSRDQSKVASDPQNRKQIAKRIRRGIPERDQLKQNPGHLPGVTERP